MMNNEPVYIDNRNLRTVKASSIKFHFNLYILQQFFLKLLLAGCLIIFATAILLSLITFILCELHLMSFCSAKFAEAKNSIPFIPIDKIMIKVLIVLAITNGISFLVRLYTNYPINVFTSFSASETFCKNTSLDKKRFQINNKILKITFGTINAFIFTPGRLIANALGIVLQAFMLLFTANKYKQLIVILTQSINAVDEEIIYACANIDQTHGEKILNNLVAGGWVLKTRNGYKLSTIQREYFDKSYIRESI